MSDRTSRTGTPEPSAAAVIPARYGSTRLPAKVLADLGGRPVIRWVHENCVASGLFNRVIIATDHPAVLEAAAAFGAEARLTDPGHATGTSRVAEVAADLKEGIVVNVQGDEPFLDSRVLEPLVAAARRPGVEVATPVAAITSGEELANPSVVKAVIGRDGRALYFSRWPVPFNRVAWGEKDPWRAAGARAVDPGFWWRHLGIYAFRRRTLLELVKLPASPAEEMEKLEQLRWLHHGTPITCVVVESRGLSIDTPGDLARARLMAAGGSGTG